MVNICKILNFSKFEIFGYGSKVWHFDFKIFYARGRVYHSASFFYPERKNVKTLLFSISGLKIGNSAEGNFRVARTLTSKMRPGAKSLSWKWVLYYESKKKKFHIKVSHTSVLFRSKGASSISAKGLLASYSFHSLY